METKSGGRVEGSSRNDPGGAGDGKARGKKGIGLGWASVALLVILAVLVMAGLMVTGSGPNQSSIARNESEPGIAQNDVGVTSVAAVAPVAQASAPAESSASGVDRNSDDRLDANIAAVGEGVSVETALPVDLAGRYVLGLSLRKEGRFDEAERAFRAALTLDPRHVKSLTNLARVLLDEGRAADAVVLVNRAVEIDPESGDARRVRGRVLHTLGVTDEAIDSYEQAIAIDDRDAWALNNLGLILIESGRFADAIAPLARATRVSAEVAVFQNNLGIALERTGRNRAAAEAYARARDIDPSNARVAENLARASALRDDPAAPELDLAALGDGFRVEDEAATPR